MTDQITVETVRAYVGGEPIGAVRAVDDSDRVQNLIRGGFLVEIDPGDVSATQPQGEPTGLPDDDASRATWEAFAAEHDLDVPKSGSKSEFVDAVKVAWLHKAGVELVGDVDQDAEAAQGDA